MEPITAGIMAGAMGTSAITGVGTAIANNQLGYSNLALQKEAFAAQQAHIRNLYQREDNAVQRRVRDLEAAGLNKVLAAGSAAQASPVKVGEAPQQQKLDDPAQHIPGLLNAFLMAKQATAQTDNITATNDLIHEQARGQKLKNDSDILRNPELLRIDKATGDLRHQEAAMAKKDRYIYDMLGVHPNKLDPKWRMLIEMAMKSEGRIPKDFMIKPEGTYKKKPPKQLPGIHGGMFQGGR